MNEFTIASPSLRWILFDSVDLAIHAFALWICINRWKKQSKIVTFVTF